MACQISTREDISKILDELDLICDPEDVLSESDEKILYRREMDRNQKRS